MFLYVIRIELEGTPNRDTYDALHERLEKLQVYRTIKADDSVRYWLPTAMYAYEDPKKISVQQIYQQLAVQVRTTGHRFRILVTLTDSWCSAKVLWDS